MPLHRRLPKRGFNNIFAKKYNELNLGRIQAAVDAGRLDGKKPITIDALKAAGLIRRAKDGVRLLGHGELKAKLAFEVTGASASAIKAVEASRRHGDAEIHHRRAKPAADAIKAKKRAEKREALPPRRRQVRQRPRPRRASGRRRGKGGQGQEGRSREGEAPSKDEAEA